MTTSHSSFSIYESADFFMVRSSLLPFTFYERMDKSTSLKEDLWKFYLDHEEFQEAIAIASPSLHKSLSLLKNQFSLSALDKVFPSILKYFLRMCSRTTPFGLFSCVSWGTFKEESFLTFHDSSIKKKIRPDMEWVDSLMRELEQNPHLFSHLRIMANPNIINKNERFCLIKKQDLKNTKHLHSIKNTSFSQTALSLAKTPLLMSELEEKLLSVFQGHEKEKISQGLAQMFQENFLISELSIRPDDPHRSSNFMKSIPLFPEEKQSLLEEVIELIKDYEKTDFKSGIYLLNELLEKSEVLKKVDYPIQVDSILQSQEIALNKKLQEELSEAATVLWLMTNRENSFNLLEEYRIDFLEKFGPYRLVPLLDLVDEITPIMSALKERSSFSTTQQSLPSILFENFKDEIVLDENIQDFFKLDSQLLQKAPLSMEIYFDILASSAEEIDRDHYQIVLNPVIGSTQAGNTFGRFLFSLEENESKVKEVKKFLEKEESLFDSAVFVEASFLPENPRTANICFFEKMRNFQLPLHYHEEKDSTLSLEDIYLGANENRFYLYCPKLEKEIYTTLSSAVNPDLAPPLLSFILNVSSSRFNFFVPYIWERIGYRIGYLPRIKYKNIILCPARWFFDFASLGVAGDVKKESLEKILLSTLENKNVPSEVLLTYFDHRLLVNWRNQDHFNLISQHFLKTKEITLFESLSTQNTQPFKGNLGSHTAEFVLPLVKKSDYRFSTVTQDFPSFKKSLPQDRLSIFQNHWTYAKLFLPQEEEFSFITKHLAFFIHTLTEKKLIDKWFYVRYKEKQSHIRLRLHGPKESTALIMESLTDWVANLISNRILKDFSLHIYDRELERYGGVDCIIEAEDVFASDTKSALYMMNIFNASGEAIPLVGLSSLAIIHYLHSFLDQDVERMLAFLNHNQTEAHLLAGSRSLLKQLFPYVQNLFFNPENQSTDETDLYFHLQQAVFPLKSSLQSYRKKIETLKEKEELWGSKELILNSLIHMHCNRLLGIDSIEEKKARALADHLLKKIHQQTKTLNLHREEVKK